jgi:hypothetical protein
MHATLTRAAGSLAAVCLAILVAGCSTSLTPSASPGGSSAGECPTTTVPARIDGWNPAVRATGIVPSIISSQQVCGRNRLLFGFSTMATNSSGQQEAVSAGSPDRTASVALFDLAKDPKKPVISVDGTFLWAIEGKTGVYVASVTFPTAGDWGAEFTTALKGGASETIRVRFEVQAKGAMPGIGDAVPSVKTATAADAGGDLKKIATDPNPNPRFYQVSEDQALAQHKPFVLVFATPAFCTSRICGPTLDKVKAMAADYPNMIFINVEPYRMEYTAGRLQPALDSQGQLQTNDASNAYKILSEPWIYVVDGNGRVTGSFETLAGPDELKAAITAATKG